MQKRGDESTLDPVTVDPDPVEGGASEDRKTPAAILLFHPDLSRVGHWAPLTTSDGERVIVGREFPLFCSSQRPGTESIGDPCLSRRQFSVAFLAEHNAFSVELLPDARRSISFLGPDGRALSGPMVPVGSTVIVEGRIAIALTLRPSRISARHHGMVGESAAMVRLRLAIDEVAALDDMVLIRGETGVGKERVAAAIHQASPRASAPFVAVNCAALPENLVETELFGSVRGAYTGATGQPGLLRAAGNGTLLLDEIGELPLPIQAKLLRVLETRRVRPVGGSSEYDVGVRLIAATHRDLREGVLRGTFRDDLLARLDGFLVKVPPLRERREDIPALLAHFTLARLRELSRDNLAAQEILGAVTAPPSRAAPRVPAGELLRLVSHRWPHNVRQVARHAAVRVARALSSGELHFPPPDVDEGDDRESVSMAVQAPRERFDPSTERPSAAALLEKLIALEFVQTRVASSFGVSAPTVDRWMRELGIRRAVDLDDAEIKAAVEASDGNLGAAAARLQVSVRGLKLRIRGEESDPSTLRKNLSRKSAEGLGNASCRVLRGIGFGTSIAQEALMTARMNLAALREELCAMGVIYAEVRGLPEDAAEPSGWTTLARVGRDAGASGVRVHLVSHDSSAPLQSIEALLPLSSTVSASSLLLRLQAWLTTIRWEETSAACGTRERPTEAEQRVQAAAQRWKLSKKESIVLSLLAKGLANKEIAADLNLSPKTVEQHVSSLLRKSGIEQRNKLIVEVHAISLGQAGGR